MERFQFQREMRLKSLHQKNLFKAKKIIANSITNHLIPQVSSLKTLKDMFDSLTKLFEEKNINWKMNLRNQLKNVKIHNTDTIHSYLTRVFHIKEHLYDCLLFDSSVDSHSTWINLIFSTLMYTQL